MNKTISKPVKSFLVDLAKLCKKHKMRFHCKDVFIDDGEEVCDLEFIEAEFIKHDFQHEEVLVFRPRPEIHTDLCKLFVSGKMGTYNPVSGEIKEE